MDSDDSSVVNAASKSLRESGILVQTVGVTLDMNLMQLVDMATSDLYVWPGVDTEMLWLLKKLEKAPCDEMNHSGKFKLRQIKHNHLNP